MPADEELVARLRFLQLQAATWATTGGYLEMRAALAAIAPELGRAADEIERLRDKGARGPDTWPRPCSICGEFLDPDLDADEPGTHEDIRCQEHTGWCDWGGCNRPAFTTRECPEDGPVPGEPLPVCIKHSEMQEAISERGTLLATIERLQDIEIRFRLDQAGIEEREADAVDLVDLRAERDRLVARVAKLTEALKEYADLGNWQFNENDPLGEFSYWIWLRDHGELRPGAIARAALSGSEEDGRRSAPEPSEAPERAEEAT